MTPFERWSQEVQPCWLGTASTPPGSPARIFGVCSGAAIRRSRRPGSPPTGSRQEQEARVARQR
jgi:hypothetical protein